MNEFADKGWTTPAKALLASGSLEPLLRLLQEVLQRDPAEHEARQLLGVALSMKGDHLQAIAQLSQAIALSDFNPDWMFNLGNIHRSAGQLKLAEQCYRRLLQLAPGHAHGWFNLGNLFAQQSRETEAADAFRRAVMADPLYTKAHVNLAGALSRTGDFDGALTVYRQILQREPAHFGARNNMANLLRELGKPQAAEQLLRQLAEEDPASARAQNNLGSALREMGLIDQALVCYARALKLKPDYPEGRMNNGMALLAAGRWAEGWVDYEARLDPKLGLLPNLYQALPAWQGQPLAGRRILVHGEQGLGDMIQFCRFVPRLQALGADVILITQATLARLMRSLPFSGRVVVEGEALPAGMDYQVSLLSLPYRLGVHDPKDFLGAPYLSADSAERAIWKARFDGWFSSAPQKQPRIGLVWAGNPRRELPMSSLMDRRRSISPDQVQALLKLDGVNWVSLQKGEGETAFANLRSAAPFLNDFADTAAACAALDAVVTVDTSVAHLAGALGCHTFMLSRFDACWRWGTGGTSTPWYPSMQVVRQPTYGDWPSALHELDVLLKKFLLQA